MSDMIYKMLRAEVKAVDEEEGIVDMLIPLSTGSVDRDGEVIEPTAFKKSLPAFRKRPILLSSHDYRDLRKQIGEFTSIEVTEKGLIGKPKYYVNDGNEEADWAFKLAARNMAAFSVGFIPKKWVDGEGDKEPFRIYKEAELLEVSQVTVPSNREAIQGVRAKEADNPIVCELCDELEKDLITKPEETDDWIRIPVRECKVTATIDISKKEGIKALYCGDDKKVRTYMFDKRDPYNWTMAKAKKWIEEHDSEKAETFKCECIKCGHKVESEKHCQDIKCPECGGEMRRVERPGPGKIVGVLEIPRDLDITQEQLSDELDYIVKLIESKGMNEEVLGDAWGLVGEIIRLTGGDIPDDILEKVGAVLNAKNLDRLDKIKTLAQEVIDSAKKEEPEEEPKEIEPPKAITEERVAQIVATAIQEAIAKAQGKV